MPFSDSWLKIRRAGKHLQEIEELIATYLAADPIVISNAQIIEVGQQSDGGPCYKFNATTSVKNLPDDLPAVLGDFVHNLRSSLDIMACELVRRAGGNGKGVYFPFAENASDLDDQIKRKKFHRAGEDAVRLLWEFAPYTGGNAALREIHDMDIADKHKSLLTNPQWQTELFLLRLWDQSGNPIEPRLELHPDAIKNFRLIFPTNTTLAGQEVIPTLHNLMEITSGVLKAFEALSELGSIPP